MRREKHIKILIDLFNDLRKEPSFTAIGFIFSAALTHMFHLTFFSELESGRIIKHDNFRSKEKIENLKKAIYDFDNKNKLFTLWKELEDKRNILCYGFPQESDISKYRVLYFEIKEILETVSKLSFEIEELEKMLNEYTD